MRSHRLALTTAAVLATVFAAGCGSGRDTGRYLPDATAVKPTVQGATAIPQVVVAGPKQEVLKERDAAKAEATQSQAVADTATKKSKAARRELRAERARARRAHRRAVAREEKLRKQLAAARKRDKAAAPAATPAPATQPADDAPITASDTTGDDLIAARNKRSDAEARAAVVRFHELLDHHDPASCSLLTAKLLTEVYGTDDAIGRCRSAAEAISAPVSVVIAESHAYGKAATLAVVTKIGDQEIPQTLRMVLVDGTWLLDAVERRPAA